MICFTFFNLLCAVAFAEGHERLLEPPSRSSMFRKGFPKPPHYKDNQLSCGGFSTNHTQAWCQSYPYGIFQITDNIAHYCERCKKCEEIVRNYLLTAVLKQCTPYLNTICGGTALAVNHFITDHGGNFGNGMGFCQLSKMCRVGYGLVENGTFHYYVDKS
ncbi:unnamed protein product [Mytilus coruscus]|uniref:Uncharacterized protein n=1 Tax=Mytilus coruscus TaxID=42192 RepID=A0A6J8AXM6_MYTCO|nr:unnamed protein product [Mytilus coruscus]